MANDKHLTQMNCVKYAKYELWKKRSLTLYLHTLNQNLDFHSKRVGKSQDLFFNPQGAQVQGMPKGHLTIIKIGYHVTTFLKQNIEGNSKTLLCI